MNTATTSWKKERAEGNVGRGGDMFRIPLANLEFFEDEFNDFVRNQDPRAEQDHLALVKYIKDGGLLPPLEVYLRKDDGRKFIVDGNRRLRAYRQAADEGAPIEQVLCVPFLGNEVDRVARIMTSNNSVPLSTLQCSIVCKKLANMGLNPEEIARAIHRTRQSVDSALVLANGSREIQELVKSGHIAATQAIKEIRKSGDRVAAETLKEAVSTAAALGKARAMPRHFASKPSYSDIHTISARVSVFLLGLAKDMDDLTEEEKQLIHDFDVMVRRLK